MSSTDLRKRTRGLFTRDELVAWLAEQGIPVLGVAMMTIEISPTGYVMGPTITVQRLPRTADDDEFEAMITDEFDAYDGWRPA